MARTYAKLQFGTERMNEILDMLLRRTVTLSDVVIDLGFDRGSAHYYLRKLVEMGKIERAEPGWDRRYKHYALVDGATLLDVPGKPEKPAPKKRGLKPGAKLSRPDGVQQVKIAKARQIGIPRDSMIAALFGGARC